MTRFHFRLERVLRWRTLELAAEEEKLKRLIAEHAQLEDTLVRLRDEIASIPTRIVELREISGRDLHGIASYARYLTRERDHTVQRLREKKIALAAQADAHRKAKQRCQLLEELRARKYQEWQADLNRQLDLIAHESYLARWTESRPENDTGV